MWPQGRIQRNFQLQLDFVGSIREAYHATEEATQRVKDLNEKVLNTMGNAVEFVQRTMEQTLDSLSELKKCYVSPKSPSRKGTHKHGGRTTRAAARASEPKQEAFPGSPSPPSDTENAPHAGPAAGSTPQDTPPSHASGEHKPQEGIEAPGSTLEKDKQSPRSAPGSPKSKKDS